MAAIDPAILKSLKHALYAYLDSYGGGEDREAVRAIAGAILSNQARTGKLTLRGIEIEAWIDDLVRDFDRSHVAERLWDEAERAIAVRAKAWREILEVKAKATLDAYIQNFAPELDTIKLAEIITTILPIVEDAQISRAEVQRLVHRITHEFDWQAAMNRVIDPKWGTFAAKVAQVVRDRNLETKVQETVQAYRVKFQPALVELGEDLVETVLQVVIDDRVNLDLDLDLVLDPESQKLVVQQVSFKLKLVDASPHPSKACWDIAQQVHDEVWRYRQTQGIEQTGYLPETTQSDNPQGNSLLGGEISIGIELDASSENQD